MSADRGGGRRLWGILAAVWLCAAGGAFADEVVLVVEGVPPCGVVVRHVDLTAAVRLAGVRDVAGASVSALDEDGKAVPFQFIPDAHRNAGNLSGLVAARLTPGRGHRLTLRFGSEAQRAAGGASVEMPFYTVVHDPLRGGLPTKIVFGKTGKVFENFRWQDRLYRQDTGSFGLQNDGGASVEVVSAGPVCTVVRVRTTYLAGGGKAPESGPAAVYDWLYLQDLPLVCVRARVSQQAVFEWSELHFLELNFPGEDFMHWAGGDPLSEGEFTGSGTSRQMSRWGALIDGRNAIAMFDCGQCLFHDGRGGYGTYLHAHGDRAWQAWSGREAAFSAWLWIGAADDATEKIQALAKAPPSSARVVATTADLQKALRSEAVGKDAWRAAMVWQLEAAGRLREAMEAAKGGVPSGWMRIDAGDMSLALEKTAGGVKVLSVFDTAVGRELLAADEGPLFVLDVRDSETKAHASLAADAGWGRVEVSGPDELGRWVVRFREAADARLAGIGVDVTVQTDGGNNAVSWDLEVTNDSPRWGLWQVTFPQVAVRTLGEGGHVFVPQTAGVEADLWNTAGRRGGTYPSGWTSMQYMAAYDAAGRTGLYVGMHDPWGSTKDIFAEGRPEGHAVAFRFDVPLPDMGKAGGDFELPGCARWQLMRGDWFDAAMIYRSWVRREARWWPALDEAGRGDTPEWMRQLPVWVMTGGAPGDCVPRVKRFAEEVGVPVGFHWYNWHQIPFDNDYPHYFPAKDGFAEGVAELKKAGVYVMPYINGRLWDTHDSGAEDREFTSVGLAGATKDEDGKPYVESYGSKEVDGESVKLAVMCPSTALWQGRIGGIVLRLFNEYGLNGVYIDQIAAAAPRLCFDASHGHPLGGGHWWTEGYWNMLDGIRGAKPAACMLTTECNAEPYVKWLDGYLTWHWQYQDMVPAFSAVYGGAVQMFGRAYRGGPSQDLANRMKAGQQLVFGEQIGWFGPEIIDRPECGAFLRDCIKLRWRLKEYFYAGSMVRPPRLRGDLAQVTADWQWSGQWPVTTSAVMCGAWRRGRDGGVVVLFANVSDAAVKSPVELDLQGYGFEGRAVKAAVIGPDGATGNEVSISAAGRAMVELGPQTAVAWEVAGTNP